MNQGKTKILSIYNFIKHQKETDGLDKIQAMKLPYIAFGFHAARNNGDYLFDNEIQAWKYGPVIPDLYYQLKSPISTSYDGSLTGEEEASINAVLERFGKKTPFHLVNLTHEKGTPWDKVFQDGKGENNEIPKKDIIKYYKAIVDTAKLLGKLKPTFERLAKT